MQKKAITCVAAGANSAALESRHAISKRPSEKRRYRELEAFGIVLLYPNSSRVVAPQSETPAALLADLEAKNARLRHQAVELALQIQELREMRLR
jgi:hypothetical protein